MGLSGLVYAIIEGPSRGWTSGVVVGAFVGSLAVLGIFTVVELHRRHPMLDLRLFKNPRFTAASLSVTALYFCLFGTIFFQTQHLQFVLGYDPLGAGLRSLPFAVVLLVVANTTPRLVRWAGTRAVITTGLGVTAAAMALRAGFTVHTRLPGDLPEPVRVRPRHGADHRPGDGVDHGRGPRGAGGVGSAINDTTRQVGGALGVAVMGSIGASIYRHSASHALSGAHLSPAVSAQALDSIGSALGAAGSLPSATAQTVADAAKQAFIRGVDIASLVGFVVAVVGALMAWRFIPAGMRVGAPAAPPASVPVRVDTVRVAVSAKVDA